MTNQLHASQEERWFKLSGCLSQSSLLAARNCGRLSSANPKQCRKMSSRTETQSSSVLQLKSLIRPVPSQFPFAEYSYEEEIAERRGKAQAIGNPGGKLQTTMLSSVLDDLSGLTFGVSLETMNTFWGELVELNFRQLFDTSPLISYMSCLRIRNNSAYWWSLFVDLFRKICFGWWATMGWRAPPRNIVHVLFSFWSRTIENKIGLKLRKNLFIFRRRKNGRDREKLLRMGLPTLNLPITIAGVAHSAFLYIWEIRKIQYQLCFHFPQRSSRWSLEEGEPNRW